MTTPAPSRLMTAEEFALTVDPEGSCSELIRGEVIYMPPPGTIHGDRTLAIGSALRQFAVQHRLGRAIVESGFILTRDPDTVRAPDAAFLANSRIPAGGLVERGYVEGAPNLAVEVVSPGDRDVDIAEKITLWLNAGAERVWEVRARTQTVTVHAPGVPPAHGRQW